MLTRHQLSLLRAIDANPSRSLIDIRRNIRTPLEEFISDLRAIEEMRLINRSGPIATTTEAAQQYLHAKREALARSSVYEPESVQPKLHPGDLYVPNHTRFLRAISKRR